MEQFIDIALDILLANRFDEFVVVIEIRRGQSQYEIVNRNGVK